MLRLLVTACTVASGASICRLLAGDPRVQVQGVDAARGFPHGTHPAYPAAFARAAAEVDAALVCSDQELWALRQGHPKVIAPPRKTIEAALDKAALYHALEGVVPVPAVIVGGFLKPRRWGDGRRLDEEDLVCEYLPGPEYSVDALVWHGALVASVVRERSTVRRGIATEGVVLHHPRLVSHVMRIAERLPLHGGINVQFRCRADGEPVLMDLNARFGGGVSISAAAGVNLPRLLVDLLLSGRAEPEEPRPGRYPSLLTEA